MKSRYAVVRIDNGIHNPHTGIVTNHRSEDAARREIERQNRMLRRMPGQATAWHPYAILDRKFGMLLP